jgi:hypothetical protein
MNQIELNVSNIEEILDIDLKPNGKLLLNSDLGFLFDEKVSFVYNFAYILRLKHLRGFSDLSYLLKKPVFKITSNTMH